MKRNHVTLFFILTFILTWSVWIPAALTRLNGGTSVLGPDSIGQFARWAPGVAAIILTGFTAGTQGIRKLFSTLIIWRVNIGWYVFALLFQPALFFVSKSIDTLLGNTYQVTSPLTTVSIQVPMVFIMIGMVVSALPGAFMEELGWRGFALPELQNKNNALIASVVLGLIWGIWHIPSMVYFGEASTLNIWFAILNTIAPVILYTWLFNNTKGSLLLVTLFHASQQYSNNFLGTIPTGTAGAITWMAALLILMITGADNLSRSSERIQSE